MGIFDKMKGAVKAVTGGAADVSIEHSPGPFRIGETVKVKVTVISTGGEVRSNGVYVDLRARESGHVHGTMLCNHCHHSADSSLSVSRTTLSQSFPLAPAFVLGEKERREFEGSITIPRGQPTYQGSVCHEWELRGRLEAFGNDPDSGFRKIMIE